MNRISSAFRFFFAAVAFAVFALPAWSAQPMKQYSLDMQLTGTELYWNDLGQPPPGGNINGILIPAGGTKVYATITNQTSTGGNSAVNSFVFAPPSGWTISGPYGKPNATVAMDDTSAPGKLKVSNITGLQPKDVQGTHAITISFILKPTSCTATTLDWTTALTVTTGTFSNTTFAWVPLTNTNQKTTPSGCGFTVSKTYDVAPAGTGAVTVSLSCANGSASPPSASVTPLNPATFTVTGFTGNPNCIATEAPIPTGYTLNSTGTCSAALLTGACTIANLVNRYTLTYNVGVGGGGTISGTTPQTNVPYGGSGSLVTAVANSGWRFVQWSDTNTNTARTDTNIQGNLTVTAQFGGTLAFTTPPHNAVVGNQIGPVVVACNHFIDGTPVTLTIDGAVPLTGTATQACVSGAATFNNVATGAGTTPGLHTFTATANDGGPTSTSATASANATLTASSGVLWCTDAGPPPSGTTIDFSQDWLSGKRFPNKDGSPCIAVNFNVQVESTVTGNKVTVLWDEVTQPNLTLKLNVTWPPELVGGDLLPKPTLYNIGLGTYTVGTCLKKNPAAPTDPDNPPEQIGTVASFIDDSAGTTTIFLNPNNAAWPTTYPFSIIVRSDDPAKDPERMLVTGAAGGGYTVVRGTGLTPRSAHSPGLPAMWTPLPLDNGTGTNAPAVGGVGGQDQVCSISDTYAAYAPIAINDPACPAQPANQEPVPCMRATQKLWAIGDLQMSRD